MPRTLRLVFTYEGDKIDLLDQQSIEMVPFPSEPVPLERDRVGFWYELQDSEEHTLYQRAIASPLKAAVEVSSDDPERPLKWQEMEHAQGHFVLYAPDIDEAHNIVLFNSPLDPKMATTPSDREAAGAPAREVARFSLSDITSQGE